MQGYEIIPAVRLLGEAVDYEHFYALDVETANSSYASICQIGIAYFANTVPQQVASMKVECQSYMSHIDPEEPFAGSNIAVHGISASTVQGSPNWAEYVEYSKLYNALNNQIVICHTSFDKTALKMACAKYGMPPINCRWMDSSQVYRKLWPEQFGRRGYGLANIASMLNIKYQAHDAMHDAGCAGAIVLAAMALSGRSLQELYPLCRIRN
jgi:DNA polymerase-3 subunit epsilon